MEETTSEFSSYGVYKIDDSLELSLPNIEIQIKKLSDNVFSYTRKDAEDNVVEKMIPVKTSYFEIELCPIRPLNYPARRTNYVYLDFETPVFLSEGSAASIYVRCPIEIGIFLIHDGHKDSLDWFACDPVRCRFGLYGTPESGTLCKYYKSDIVESYDDSISFVNAVMQIRLRNELGEGHSISKVVFPISNNTIYYQKSKAIIDSLDAVMRKKLTLEILDVYAKKLETDWTVSPTYEVASQVKNVDMGVD
ncbi:DUF432 domain-containing protein [Nitrosopumilus sp. K4]|uniref:DUF432 domain-containing protein n=1 Tax=Nitrosopumilus sp. K4 TaxID=2795383 RepID=UPI001BA4D7E2|nr:DUF432 domain-containing protein [Nitrosopumilus sp. K4]QUC65218.1 DUF432 domain-containing protein [Nitrosopumilus sp. K4]